MNEEVKNRITEENYSFDSLYDYKSARRIMQVYNDCKGNTNAAIRIYAKKTGCTEETAAQKLKSAGNSAMPSACAAAG